MNVPGRAEGNWSWRCTEELLSAAAFHGLGDLTKSSNRLPMLPSPATELAEAGYDSKPDRFSDADDALHDRANKQSVQISHEVTK